MRIPNKDEKFPLPHHRTLCFLKNIITNPNIIVGDYGDGNRVMMTYKVGGSGAQTVIITGYENYS